MSHQQPRQSRWGAPLSSSSSSSAPPSSTSIPPPAAAAASLPEATNYQQIMSEFPKLNNPATAQRTTSSSQHEGQHGDPQHQLHRRGYDMSSNDDYYGGMMMISVVHFSTLFPLSHERIVC